MWQTYEHNGLACALMTACCHSPDPLGWGLVTAPASCPIPPAVFLLCRAMPVLPGWLALGCGAVLLLLLYQKELGAEQRGLLLPRGTAGHHPSQHHPGECTQPGLSSSLPAWAVLVTTSWSLSSHPCTALSQLPGPCAQSLAKPPGRVLAMLCPYSTAPITNCVAGLDVPPGDSCGSSLVLGFLVAHS